MEIIKVELDAYSNFIVSINVWVVIGVTVLVTCVSYIIKRIRKKYLLKSIRISEATIGVGNSTITVKYDKRIQEIAYRIWVEINTRKIGLMFDEENDVITEIYNSWYAAFSIIRNQLEEIPVERFSDAEGLTDLTIKVLNEGLRPHLTRWQAKYRVWFENEMRVNEGKTPQEIQKSYPKYTELVQDIKKTNEIMVRFSEELYRVVYG